MPVRRLPHPFTARDRAAGYLKEGRALRTETTINNAYDFAIGRRLHNLPALRRVGFTAKRRLLALERLTHDCLIAEDVFHALTQPTVINGRRVSALRFADPRSRLLLHTAVKDGITLPTGSQWRISEATPRA